MQSETNKIEINKQRNLPQVPKDRVIFREFIKLFFNFAPILLLIVGLSLWYAYSRIFGELDFVESIYNVLLDMLVVIIVAFGGFVTFVFSVIGLFYKVILSFDGIYIKALKTSASNNFIKWEEIEKIELTKLVYTKRTARLNPFSKSYDIVNVSADELYNITSIRQYRKKRFGITFSRPVVFDEIGSSVSTDGVDYDKIGISVSKKMISAIEKYAPYEIKQQVFTLLRYQSQSKL